MPLEEKEMNEKRKIAGKEYYDKRAYKRIINKENLKQVFRRGKERIEEEESQYIESCGEFEFMRELERRR